MLSKNDMSALRGLMREVIIETVPGMMRENNEIFGSQLKREIRDEIHSLIKASEAGLIRRMDEMEIRLIQRMDGGFDAINELIDDGILPQVNDLDRRVTRLEPMNTLV